MAITNRSAINESGMLGTPAGDRTASRMGGLAAGNMIMPNSNLLDDSSFLGSQAGYGDEPQQAYRKIRERLIELEIEKEEQEK